MGQGPSNLSLLSGKNSNELFAVNERCQREVSKKPWGRIETYLSDNLFNSLHLRQLNESGLVVVQESNNYSLQKLSFIAE